MVDWTQPLHTVVSEVLRLLCRLDGALTPVGPAPVGPVASVEFRGGFEGALVVAATERFALTAAGLALGSHPHAISAAEVRDLMEELASTIAGNLKPALPGPTSLALPTCGGAPESAGASLLGEVRYSFEGEAIQVALYASSAPRGGVSEDSHRG